MRRFRLSKPALAACIAALMVSPPLLAHHSHATLDHNDVRVLRGVVKKYSWSMPHVFLKVEAPNPEGKLVEYSIEMLHPAAMAERVPGGRSSPRRCTMTLLFAPSQMSAAGRA